MLGSASSFRDHHRRIGTASGIYYILWVSRGGKVGRRRNTLLLSPGSTLDFFKVNRSDIAGKAA